MTTFFKSTLAVGALALALALPAHAQLTISGSSHGDFFDPGQLHTTVTNGPVISLFESGVPYRPNAPHFDTKTSIKFTGQTFTDLGDGDIAHLGQVNIKNGVTLLGTTAGWAAMDLFLNIPASGVWDFKLTTLLFTIDNTANTNGSAVPDLFFIGYTEPAALKLPEALVTFDLWFSKPAFSTGAGASINEGKSATDDIYATLNFTPVPEASTYALWGAALLVGLVAIRRVRTEKFAA